MVELKPIEQRIQRDVRILAAYVLGSAVDGRLRFDSDVDIAILPVAGKKLSATDICELAGDLSLAAGRTVDVGVLSSRNLVYSCQALLRGRPFFCRDATAAGLAAASLLGLAMQFRFERKEIADAYRA